MDFSGYDWFDTSGDGWGDVGYLDTTGNGWYDVMAVDVDNDGYVDNIHFDQSGDGRFEAVGWSSRGDGYFDSVAIDTSGDGYYDSQGFDATRDGRADWILGPATGNAWQQATYAAQPTVIDVAPTGGGWATVGGPSSDPLIRLLEQAYASGDQNAIASIEEMIASRHRAAAVWLGSSYGW